MGDTDTADLDQALAQARLSEKLRVEQQLTLEGEAEP
jgi:hypothetical protein